MSLHIIGSGIIHLSFYFFPCILLCLIIDICPYSIQHKIFWIAIKIYFHTFRSFFKTIHRRTPNCFQTSLH